jgi:RNA polymerase sigma-70 factor (ECF subfamily)
MEIKQGSDDRLLIEQIILQDQEALGMLYARYAAMVKGLAYRILNSPEEAEEVVLDVFSQIWRKASSYDSRQSRVDTWIFMIARSRTLDKLRSLSRLAQVVTACEHLVSVPLNTPEEELIISERREQVRTAMANLPSEQRQVIELAYYQGLSHTEIAAKMNLPLGTIKTRIRLGLNKLRQGLSS